jgi:hypothetical protein
MNTYKVFVRKTRNAEKLEIGTVQALSKKEACIEVMQTNQNKWVSVELVEGPKNEPGKTYKATKQSENSNTVVTELNAAVLTSTFKNKGIQLADLCQSLNGSKELVSKGHCIPVNSKIIDTVLIDL